MRPWTRSAAKHLSISWACCATPTQVIRFWYCIRRAVLDYWVEQGDELSAVLAQVMVHEAAHQLELSEEQVSQLEAEIEASTPQPRTVQ